MDQIFNDAYENLFSEFPIFYDYRFYGRELFGIPPDVSENDLRTVRNAIIESVNNSKSKTIRPDAKLFLMANYTYMVLFPLLLANRSRDNRFPLNKDFRDKIKNDIRVIFEQASIETSNESPNEITSHSILKAIDNRWKTLYSTTGISWSDGDN